MKHNSKSQVSVFEIGFAVTLLFAFTIYFGFYIMDDGVGVHKTQVESFTNSMYYSEEFRNLFMNEDLSQSTITQNWTNFSNLASNAFVSYSLVLSNETINKTIYSCTEISGKEITEKIMFIRDNNYSEFRKITFGVCY